MMKHKRAEQGEREAAGGQRADKLLKDNERVRMVIAKLKTENQALERRLLDVSTQKMGRRIEQLETQIESLKVEKAELLAQLMANDEQNHYFADRYRDVEHRSSELINMYVATYRLHSTFDYATVLDILREIVVNIIGAEKLGIFMLNEEEALELVAEEGIDESERALIATGSQVLRSTALSGQPFVATDRETEGGLALSEPIACIPLKFEESTIGVIAVYTLLTQKAAFQAIDHELFEMLCAQASRALLGAKLFAQCVAETNIKPKGLLGAVGGRSKDRDMQLVE